MKSNSRRMGQKDIAKAAGVSQSVVSHVINDNHDISISPDTRQRVLEAIDRLDYIPNRAAQSLRSRKTLTIAAIIPDITNPYYPEFLRGIQDDLQPAGYDLITYNTDGILDLERKGIRAALRAHVDGLIAMLFHVSSEELLQILGDVQPVVLLSDGKDVDPDTTAMIDCVGIDGVAAGKLITDYLIERGHRRIVMLAGKTLTPPRESRLKGYLDSLVEHDIQADESLVFAAEFDETGGYLSMLKVLDMDTLPTAVFAANDLMALGALRACRERGIQVPQQIAIAGFDDIPAAAFVHPPLTTLDQHARFTGQRAARLLLDRLTTDYTGPIRREPISVELVVREST